MRKGETHRLELLEGDLAVLVSVALEDGLVNNLLELDVGEVAADHHLQDLEELAVGDEAVAVNVVNAEGDWREDEHREPRGIQPMG